ncbi:hypothetical protein OnM2_062055 [Erysiphe neolycopersici]|uniref:Uncharacterized protein n=1 Tax=Erysiphe neolycopersici TaxID=212602 RepID=A0A420HP28_9PEZI|nr:hypothetical protein OnM2_062055 [Erysiphe neolycopersici]
MPNELINRSANFSGIFIKNAMNFGARYDCEWVSNEKRVCSNVNDQQAGECVSKVYDVDHCGCASSFKALR